MNNDFASLEWLRLHRKTWGFPIITAQRCHEW